MFISGSSVAIVLRILGYRSYRYAGCYVFEVKEGWGGLNLGIFTIVCKDASDATKNHEFGHAIQTCVFGPLTPFIVLIPSAIRYWYRNIRYNSKGITPKTAYDDFWVEGQATKLGNKFAPLWCNTNV